MTRNLLVWTALLCASCGNSGGGGSPDMAMQPTQDMTMPARDMVMPPDMTPPGCDPVAQDCTDQTMTKCTVTQAMPMAMLTPMCVAPTGMGMDGAACTRTNNMVGLDDCSKGLFCSGLGTLMTPPSRHCRKFCNADGDCAMGSQCAGLVPTPPIGLCVPTCAVFGTTCGAGLDCDSLFVDNDGMSVFFSCRMAGTGAAGASCMNGDQDCVAGAVCLDPTQMNMPKCYTLCDATHPCPAGACKPFVMGQSTGVCM
jgi:hypothetical protein